MSQPGAGKSVPTARIRFASWAELVRFLMQDSEGRGLFVRAATPPAIGTELTVVFMLPDGRDLALPARVMHRVTAEEASDPGMGVQFTHMSEEQAARLQQLMSNPEVARSIQEAQPQPAPQPAPRPHAARIVAPAPRTPGATPAKRPMKTTPRAQPAPPPPEPPAPAPAQEELDPRLAQAATLLERARFDAAERSAMDVLGDDPGNAQAQKLLLVIQARRLRSQFDFDRAAQKYRAVLKLDPHHAEAREQLAGLDGDIERSRELFDRVFGGK